MGQRPLSVHAWHVAWARNEPLLFKALRFGGSFVTTIRPSPSWLVKLGPGTLKTIPRTTFTENLTLRAHFWRRNFVVQKPIKEAKPNPFSLFSQRGNWCEFPNLTHKRQHGLSSFIGWWMSFPAWMEAPEGCYSLMFRINKCSKCIWSIWRAFMRVSGDFINSFCYLKMSSFRQKLQYKSLLDNITQQWRKLESSDTKSVLN